MAIEKSVNSPDHVANEFPWLIHYTSSAGLHGILTTGTLRASHMRFLNDDEEFEGYYRHRLQRVVTDAILPAIECGELHPYWQEKLKQAGTAEKRAYEFSRRIGQALRQVADMHEPYAASFCAHEIDDLSGLLSQWRGYGADGGYAIVFDTKALLARLVLEMGNWAYHSYLVAPVDYGYEENATRSQRAQQHEAAIGKFCKDWLKRDSMPNEDVLYTPLVSLPTLTKHSSFSE